MVYLVIKVYLPSARRILPLLPDDDTVMTEEEVKRLEDDDVVITSHTFRKKDR